MTLSINITGDALLATLRTFLLAAFAGEVVQGQANRVTMPQGNFIEMTPMLASDLSTAMSIYAPDQQVQAIVNAVKWTCQLDFYGPNAGDNANTFKAVIRTDWACTKFAASGMDFQPLYAGDARNTAMINGQQQYENRYTLDFVAQFNPQITVPQNFGDTFPIGVFSVDVVAPP